MQKTGLFLLSLIILFASFKEKKKNTMYLAIQTYLTQLSKDFNSIPQPRKELLKELSTYIQNCKDSAKQINLTFICTHNSRRSHMSQIWASAAAAYYGIEGVNTYSGGTEATAFNPRAVAAMERVGFVIENPGGNNPHYLVRFGPNLPALECFSKKYSDAFNPQSNFAAVMTCSQADQACPIVFGAAERISLPYEDPKAGDGTPEEAAIYDLRCKQIATEICYAFSLVK